MNRKEVLRKGETLTLRLNGLASAGYEWKGKVDTPNIVAIEKEYELPKTTSRTPMAGSAQEIFTIKALKPGNTIIQFTQARSFEPEKLPHDELIIDMEVIL